MSNRYETPAEGTQQWHEQLDEIFDTLGVDVEIRDEGPPTDHDYEPAEGAKYLDTSNGDVYISGDSDWGSPIGSLNGGGGSEDASEPGRYLEDDGGVRNFTGPAEWENDGETDTNVADGTASTVAGGRDNEASAFQSTVGGGDDNDATGNTATVGGGHGNEASGSHSTVGGGRLNEASGSRATVAGGSSNEASGDRAAVSGGLRNTAAGDDSMVAGGADNTIEEDGDYSFAVGREATVEHAGAFVVGDSSEDEIASLFPNQARFQGQVRADAVGTESSFAYFASDEATQSVWRTIMVEGDSGPEWHLQRFSGGTISFWDTQMLARSGETSVITLSFVDDTGDETIQRTAGPIAKGRVNEDGSLNKGINVESSEWNSGANRYEITIDGLEFDNRDHIATVTPSGDTLAVRTGSLNNDLLVYFEGDSQAAFNFVVHSMVGPDE